MRNCLRSHFLFFAVFRRILNRQSCRMHDYLDFGDTFGDQKSLLWFCNSLTVQHTMMLSITMCILFQKYSSLLFWILI